MIIVLAIVLAWIAVRVLDTIIVFFGGIYLAFKRKQFERWLNEH